MTRRARLLAGLGAHRAAFAERLDGLPDEIVHARPASGAWSLAQLAEHLLLIDGGLRPDGPLAGGLARATSGLRSGGIRLVLSLPVRIPAPPSAQSVMPSAAPRWPDVRQRWAALRAGWRERDPQAGTVAFSHPIAGPFLPDDALAFLLAHHRHHDAQVRRTLAGLARDEV
ncbi:DinB family protein [Rubrivirga sp. IMCC43871]|uniref:DinB family protein n=1 Tax=Rubrivirga sp. IMCC43871 TaxID=3391575 RepID=UPI00398FB5A6